MVSTRSSALWLLCVVAASGCSSSGDPCRTVTCSHGRVCEKETGACVKDPNPPDAAVVDSGTADAGGVDAGVLGCLPACGAGTVCDPVSLNCVQCVSNAQCACPAALCDPVSHSCVEALPDAGTFVQPIGESCANALVISFPICSPNLTTFQVDLTPLADNETGTCSSAAGGRDAVFLLNVPSLKDVKVTTSQPAGSGAQPVVYLRMSPCATGAELACRDSFGATSSIRAKSVAPGVYALVIDAYTSLTFGPVDVTVELLPPVTNDTCAAPLEASTDGGSVTVDLSGAGDDLAASCNTAADSRDAVWRVTLDQRSAFHAVVRPLVADAGIDTVVYLRGSPCASGTPVLCVDNQTDGPEQLLAQPLSAGTWFLVVEGYGTAGSGPVELTTWSTPAPLPPNDTCAAPRPIDLQSASSIRFPVNTAEGENDDRGSCGVPSGGSTGRELVYSFTLPIPRTVTITSESADGGTEVDPVIYLREGACSPDAGIPDAGRELGCADAFPDPEVLVRALPAGQYFLFVDSYSSASAGPTIVTVTLSP